MKINIGIPSHGFVGEFEVPPSPPEGTYHLNLDGTDDSIIIPSSIALDDLPLHDFCIEMVMRNPVFTDGQYILKKGDPTDDNDSGLIILGSFYSGMMIYIMLEDEIYPTAMFDIPSSGWHAYEFDFNSTTKSFDVWIDGINAVTSRIAGTISPYISDSGYDMTVLNGFYDTDHWFTEGKIRWLMISDVIKHTSSFIPPSLTICPDLDLNTVLRLALEEGLGTVAEDTSIEGNDGTIYGATWELDEELEYPSVDNDVIPPVTDGLLACLLATNVGLPYNSELLGWIDSSGNNHHFQSKQLIKPILKKIHGKPIIYIPLGTELESIDDFGDDTDQTIFVLIPVINSITFLSKGNGTGTGWEAYASSNNYVALDIIADTDWSDYMEIYSDPNTSDYDNFPYLLIVFRVNGSGIDMKLNQQDSDVYESYPPSNSPMDYDNSQKWLIGVDRIYGEEYFNSLGYKALLFYNRILSDMDRHLVEDWILSKFAEVNDEQEVEVILSCNITTTEYGRVLISIETSRVLLHPSKDDFTVENGLIFSDPTGTALGYQFYLYLDPSSTATVKMTSHAAQDQFGNYNSESNTLSIIETSDLPLLFKDTFSIPRTIIPGEWFDADTIGRWVSYGGDTASIAEDNLVFTGQTGKETTIYSDYMDNAVGLATYVKEAIEDGSNVAAGMISERIFLIADPAYIIVTGTEGVGNGPTSQGVYGIDPTITPNINTYHEGIVISRGGQKGVWFMEKKNGASLWTINFISNWNSLRDHSIYADMFSSALEGKVAKIDTIKMAILPSIDDMWAFNDNHLDSVLAGQTLTTVADSFVEAERTMESGETFNLSFRQTDTDNKWIVRLNETTLDLIQVEAGVETVRRHLANAACVAGTSCRIWAFTGGTYIKFGVESHGGTLPGAINYFYSPATFNQTAIMASVDVDCDFFASSPRVLSEDFQTILNGFGGT